MLSRYRRPRASSRSSRKAGAIDESDGDCGAEHIALPKPYWRAIQLAWSNAIAEEVDMRDLSLEEMSRMLSDMLRKMRGWVDSHEE